MVRNFCCTTVPPFNPMRLASNYRDGFGDPHARLVELMDPIIQSGCFEPRIFHAPDTQSENVGLTAKGYLEYVMDIPPGSFILAYLHHATALENPNNSDAPPVQSTFRMQITDVARNYKFFQKPMPEAFFLNDAPSNNTLGPYANGGILYELNPSPRPLTAPYPVAPPGKFMVEFWNLLSTPNALVQMTFLVAIPAKAR
jgi:hypothetical protein